MSDDFLNRRQRSGGKPDTAVPKPGHRASASGSGQGAKIFMVIAAVLLLFFVCFAFIKLENGRQPESGSFESLQGQQMTELPQEEAPAAAAGELIYADNGIAIYRQDYSIDEENKVLHQDYLIENTGTSSRSVSPDPSFISIKLAGYEDWYPGFVTDPVLEVGPGQSRFLSLVFIDENVENYRELIDSSGSMTITMQMGIAGDGILLDVFYDEITYTD